MKTDNAPYPECEACKDLGDCKHVDIAQDGMGTILTPDNCPKPNKVMAATEKRRKRYERPID